MYNAWKSWEAFLAQFGFDNCLIRSAPYANSSTDRHDAHDGPEGDARNKKWPTVSTTGLVALLSRLAFARCKRHGRLSGDTDRQRVSSFLCALVQAMSTDTKFQLFHTGFQKHWSRMHSGSDCFEISVSNSLNPAGLMSATQFVQHNYNTIDDSAWEFVAEHSGEVTLLLLLEALFASTSPSAEAIISSPAFEQLCLAFAGEIETQIVFAQEKMCKDGASSLAVGGFDRVRLMSSRDDFGSQVQTLQTLVNYTVAGADSWEAHSVWSLGADKSRKGGHGVNNVMFGMPTNEAWWAWPQVLP